MKRSKIGLTKENRLPLGNRATGHSDDISDASSTAHPNPFRHGAARLIVLEGADGVGKTTLARRLTTGLRKQGIPCLGLSFPGTAKNTLGGIVYEIHHSSSRKGRRRPNALAL